MKIIAILSSLLVTCAFGEVISSGYSTYVQTPEAISKMARNDAGFTYSVTSGHGHPGSFLYGLQTVGTPLALTYSSLGATPVNYISRNVFPYDIYNSHAIQKVVIPYSTLALSPLISQLSAIYQTSSIPASMSDSMKKDETKTPISMDRPVMAEAKPMFPHNPFLAPFFDQNKLDQQVPMQNLNPISSSSADDPTVQGNSGNDIDTVAIESA